MARKPSSRSSRALPKLRHVGSGAKFDKVVAIGQAGRQSLRIIGGEWRGRKIPFATVIGLRPTQDRVRETLFNWLSGPVVGARCLDLFAGTGALGLEALSRGAKHVTFVDLSNIATTSLKDNLKQLPLAGDQTTLVEQKSSFDWLKNYQATEAFAEQGGQYQVVFLDPPFALALVPDILKALLTGNCLAHGAMIYVEQAQPLAELDLPSPWKLHRSKKAGQVYYGLISQ
ncbi:16S rRNA (guanine(966)-N(2))-methyltransferase RsmD [Oceanospirillaceae bacterium]|nr:16S rRNA (guanine(966)-N(2))-methyltransferase RsmD [Oceanospirillaceae bacterium]MBT6099987.1 16S rRNA (guanine(966)-N(2))-methyltransferase RsmD [Oceanospirillaceae bacterium]MBT7673301.1 16S rRNA (guanine(966)-N(2))-methyltransferase RsmD [Oceanospirillaceae bacterium]MDC1227549.1 16S rRNA (guanine(966)-N(2))-methyltransferase RsmD [Oceanospirillaceae bacterium]MDC1424797.1 16S rRNA (guanine(966)-N(2))-methyltransferase RsmD [Oceanospirillaceae bacterium]